MARNVNRRKSSPCKVPLVGEKKNAFHSGGTEEQSEEEGPQQLYTRRNLSARTAIVSYKCQIGPFSHRKRCTQPFNHGRCPTNALYLLRPITFHGVHNQKLNPVLINRFPKSLQETKREKEVETASTILKFNL